MPVMEFLFLPFLATPVWMWLVFISLVIGLLEAFRLVVADAEVVGRRGRGGRGSARRAGRSWRWPGAPTSPTPRRSAPTPFIRPLVSTVQMEKRVSG